MPLDGTNPITLFTRTAYNTMQHLRRLGTPGAPSTLLPGQFAINQPAIGVWPNLYAGGVPVGAGVWGSMTWGQSTWGGTSEVLTLVSPTRQVELIGNQTITGNKTIAINSLKIPGGAPGFLISTDGVGNLSFVPRDGSLPSAGGTVTGDLNFTGNISLNGIPLVADAPADGKMYVRANESWVWLQTGVSGFAGGGGGIEEAPMTGQIYGRLSASWTPVLPLSGGTMTGDILLPPTQPFAPTPDNAAVTKAYVDNLIATGGVGQPSWTDTTTDFAEPAVGGTVTITVANTAWMAVGAPLFISGLFYRVQTVNSATSVTLIRLDAGGDGYLPLTGGTLTGPLILNGPPGTSSPANQAATKGYVDSIVTGAMTFIGTINATTGNATYTTASGFANGPVPVAPAASDMYLICNIAGTIPSGPAAGLVLAGGDWLLSDGSTWTVIQLGGQEAASNVTLTPAVYGQTNVQDALEHIESLDLQPSFTTVSTLFTPPAVGSPVTINVVSTAWMDVGTPILIAGATYIVGSIGSATQVTLDRVN